MLTILDILLHNCLLESPSLLLKFKKMANVKCDLNNLILLDGIQNNTNLDECTKLNDLQTKLNVSSCSNGCTNLINCSNNSNQSNVKSKEEQSSFLKTKYNLFNNSIYNEVIKNNKFKDKKADLSFPRKFVNILKKVDNGKANGTKKITKICVLQPSLFENIPFTIYFGLDDELS